MAHKYADDERIISDYLPEAVSAEEIVTIGKLNEAVSAFVDRYTRRPANHFAAQGEGAVGTVRRIRGTGKNYLQLPAHILGTVSVSGITANQWYESGINGWLYARNDYLQPELEDSDFFRDAATFFDNRYVYLVTAVWGYLETPPDIIAAVSEIVSRQFSKGQGILGETSPAGFVIEVDIPRNAALILEQYIPKTGEII